MRDKPSPLWPLPRWLSWVAALALLAALLALVAVFRATWQWPSAGSDTVVLIGIFIVSFVPILLVLVDVVVERGAVIEYGGVKIDLSRSSNFGSAGLHVAANIGVRGQPVGDSGTMQILETLNQAASNSIAVIDLEDGQAWWETRLLVLLSGAVRLGQPEKVVFVATSAKKEQSFCGWATPAELLPLLTRANPQFPHSLQLARTVAGQLALIEPNPPALQPGQQPSPWLADSLPPIAKGYQWLALDQKTRLPNLFAQEQILASELGNLIERPNLAVTISRRRLDELFEPVLDRSHIDFTWDADRQLDAILKDSTPFVAMTVDGIYRSLASRTALSNEVLRAFVKRGKTE